MFHRVKFIPINTQWVLFRIIEKDLCNAYRTNSESNMKISEKIKLKVVNYLN